jgi:hypothetical protein
MRSTRTRSTARRMSSTGLGNGCRPPSTTGADAVLRRIDSGDPMTVAELRHAAAVLGRFVLSRRQDVLVARVRIAVRLERLGA